LDELQVKDIPLELIDDFPDHPYLVKDDESMLQLVESVSSQGVLVPAIVRPKGNGRYELISGHRRKRASQLSELSTLKCIVGDYDNDTATIMMVDSNLNRESILPSEKAKAYKMRLDAMKHQGRATSRPLGNKLKSVDELAEISNDSARQIQRYIRLNYLVPELLDYVDEGKVKMRPAVELSYLDEDCQRDVVDFIDENESTPSHAQTIRLRKLYNEGKLDTDEIYSILSECKPNQQEHISVPVDRIKRELPKTPSKRIDFIVKAIEYYSKYLERKNRER
jgi:ParB family chromosome partitioning protein